jgi:hypothetical protein
MQWYIVPGSLVGRSTGTLSPEPATVKRGTDGEGEFGMTSSYVLFLIKKIIIC